MESVSLLREEVSNSAMRLDFCEFCGASPGYYETHHVKTVGSGGPDIRANKINLGAGCGCHTLAQEHKIKPYQLIVVIARRENASVAEVYQAIGWPLPGNISELEGLVHSSEPSIQTLEDLISILITTKQEEQERHFLQGEIIGLILARSIEGKTKTTGWVSSQTGWSPAHIRVLYKTYLAFPDEGTRVPSLTWSHHKIAAATNRPHEWIMRAAAEEMSTRQLRIAIAGKAPVTEDELSMKRAKKVLEAAALVISRGGPAALWLVTELKKALEISQNKFFKSGGVSYN